MSELEERLLARTHAEDARRSKPAHPAGWEPGVVLEGNTGTLTTAPLTTKPTNWDAILRIWGLDPTEFEVLEPVQMRAWDAQTPEGTQRMYYYRANIIKRRSLVPATELIAALGRHKKKPLPEFTGQGHWFVQLMGDTQIGKPDGDGTAGTVERFMNGLDATVDRIRELRRNKRTIDVLCLPWLGDCIEGFNSQGGRLMWRNQYTLTEQVQVVRRMMIEQVKKLAPLASRVVMPVVPGNHDEAIRVGDKMATRYDDSWAVEAAVSVADALKLSEAYDHVSIVVPKKDELTITLDMAGTIVGMAHGHQFGRDPIKWWAYQAHGMQAIGDATLLLAGHLHHFSCLQSGAKTFLQIPALDGGSTHYRHRYGEDAPAGIVTLCVGGGGWSDLAIL